MHYILVGDSLEFLPQISFYGGVRLELEKIALFFNFQKHGITDNEYDEISKAISQVEGYLLGRSKKATGWRGLFLYTYRYKNTVCVGCGQANTRMYFFKIFTSEHAANKEKNNTRILQALYGQWFSIPEVIYCSDRILVLSFLERTVKADKQAVYRMLTKAIAHNKNTHETGSALLEDTLTEIISLSANLGIIGITKKNIHDLSEKINEQMGIRWQQYPWYLCHGDMTPWNMYHTPRGRIALVDSECVGPRSLFSDLLHYHIQPIAMQRFSLVSPIAFISFLCQWTHLSIEEAYGYVILYLLEELSKDMKDLSTVIKQPILTRSIVRKLSWLHTITRERPDMYKKTA